MVSVETVEPRIDHGLLDEKTCFYLGLCLGDLLCLPGEAPLPIRFRLSGFKVFPGISHV